MNNYVTAVNSELTNFIRKDSIGANIIKSARKLCRWARARAHKLTGFNCKRTFTTATIIGITAAPMALTLDGNSEIEARVYI